MKELLESSLVLLSILGIIGTWLYQAVSLKASIKSLTDTVHQLAEEISESRNDRRLLASRLTAVEVNVKSAHKRIDELYEDFHHTGGRYE